MKGPSLSKSQSKLITEKFYRIGSGLKPSSSGKDEENVTIFLRQHDIQHNDTQHNDTQHNDTQHNNTVYRHSA
jgi:hypothetical protein